MLAVPLALEDVQANERRAENSLKPLELLVCFQNLISFSLSSLSDLASTPGSREMMMTNGNLVKLALLIMWRPTFCARVSLWL